MPPLVYKPLRGGSSGVRSGLYPPYTPLITPLEGECNPPYGCSKSRDPPNTCSARLARVLTDTGRARPVRPGPDPGPGPRPPGPGQTAKWLKITPITMNLDETKWDPIPPMRRISGGVRTRAGRGPSTAPNEYVTTAMCGKRWAPGPGPGPLPGPELPRPRASGPGPGPRPRAPGPGPRAPDREEKQWQKAIDAYTKGLEETSFTAVATSPPLGGAGSPVNC